MSEAKHKGFQGKGIKILTPKQMLQRLSIALAQVKVGNASSNLLNGIRQIVYSLYQAKQITKKVYNIIKSVQIKMNIIFMNSEECKTSHPDKLLVNLTDKIDSRVFRTLKNIKSSYSKIEFKMFASTWNNKFELPDGSYSVSDIQDLF